MTPSKPIFESKTILFNLIIGVTSFVPAVKTFIAAHVDLFLYGLVIVNMGLRFVTKGGISLFGKDE